MMKRMKCSVMYLINYLQKSKEDLINLIGDLKFHTRQSLFAEITVSTEVLHKGQQHAQDSKKERNLSMLGIKLNQAKVNDTPSKNCRTESNGSIANVKLRKTQNRNSKVPMIWLK